MSLVDLKRVYVERREMNRSSAAMRVALGPLSYLLLAHFSICDVCLPAMNCNNLGLKYFHLLLDRLVTLFFKIIQRVKELSISISAA